jgi:hypothetical protein
VRKPKESPVNYVPCLQMRKDRPHYCPTCPQNFPKKLDFLIMFWEKLTELLCSILTEASMATRKIKKSRPISRISGTKLECMQIEISTEKSLTEELATLLQAHWLFCTANTPIEHVYALDASRLFITDITVFGARIQDELVGVGALRILDIEHAELKSMHTLSQSRGLGIGKALSLIHISEPTRQP